MRPTLRILAIAICLGAQILPAQVPADAVLSGFQPNGEFLFELDGQDVKDAEIFFGERAGAFLIMAPVLSSPLLLGTRTGMVESVHLMKVAKRPDGSVDLLADATLDRISPFQLDGTEVTFDLKGKPAKLKPKPALVGFQKAATLIDYKADYGFLADAYTPSSSALATLKKESRDVRVLIYFGTWCPTCSRLVPRTLRVARELEGSKVHFEYYGLPRDMTNDPRTEKDKIQGVPTGIVYLGEQEIGRLGVKELNEPEAALRRMLTKG